MLQIPHEKKVTLKVYPIGILCFIHKKTFSAGKKGINKIKLVLVEKVSCSIKKSHQNMSKTWSIPSKFFGESGHVLVRFFWWNKTIFLLH